MITSFQLNTRPWTTSVDSSGYKESINAK